MWTAITLALAFAPEIPVAPPSDEVAITWSAVEACPDREAVAAELAELLATRQTSVVASASGNVTRDDEGYVLRLDVEVQGHHERRTLHAADCMLLVRAGALVIAVTVDAMAATDAITRAEAGEPDPDPEPLAQPGADELADDGELELGLEPSEPPTRTPAVTPALEVASPPPPRARAWPMALTLAAHGGLGFGLVPGLGGGIEGELGWRAGPLRVAAAGYHWFARTASVAPDAGVRVAVSGAWLRGGAAWSIGRVEIPLTVGIDLAAMHGGGVGARVDAVPVRDLWVAITAGPGVEVWLGRRFAITARVDAIVAARRPAMSLNLAGVPTVAYRMPDAGFRLMLGGRLRFWETKPRPGGAR